MKKSCALFFGLPLIVVLGGCSCPPPAPMPEYPPLEKSYDTSALLYLYPFQPEWVMPLMARAFSVNGYFRLAGELPMEQPDTKKAKIVIPLDFSQRVLPQKEGFFLETRIIVMVRRPAQVRGADFACSREKRYFQARSRLVIANKEATQEQLTAEAGKVLENLFTIPGFREALEPPSSGAE